MRKSLVFLSLILLVYGVWAQSSRRTASPTASVHFPPAAIAAFQKIDAERIRAHVRFLSHDLLEGRGTGQRGGDIAAEYIATQFSLYGLKPAGDNGTYLQKVPMVGVTPAPETTFSLVSANGSKALKPLSDYVAYDETQQPDSMVNADIVFVGYGVEAPEYQWDDYKGVDVKGKVLLMLVNEPPSDDPNFFKGKALTYYGRWVYKFEKAARKGAVGALLIHKTDMASYPWEVVRNSNSGEKSYLKLDGSPKLKVASWIHLDVAKELAATAGMDLDKMMADARSRDFHPVALPVKLQAHMVSKVRPFESNNVVAMLPGSDAKLRSEAVMYTAHYDHLGVRPDMAGGQHLQRRRRQRHWLRHSDRTGTCFLWSYGAAAAFHYFCVRDGGRTRTAGLRISWQASSHTRRKNHARLELRRHSPARLSGRSGSLRLGANDFLSRCSGAGGGVSVGDSSRCPPRSRTLLPLRSFQPGPSRYSRVFDE